MSTESLLWVYLVPSSYCVCLKPSYISTIYNSDSKLALKKFKIKDETQAGRWWCTPLILALRRQRQVDLCKFEANLDYKANSRTIQAVAQRNPVLKKLKKINKNKNRKKNKT